MYATEDGHTESGAETLHDIPDARMRLGKIAHSTFYELVKDGRIRTVHIGRRAFVPSSEIDRYIASLMAGDAE